MPLSICGRAPRRLILPGGPEQLSTVISGKSGCPVPLRAAAIGVAFWMLGIVWTAIEVFVLAVILRSVFYINIYLFIIYMVSYLDILEVFNNILYTRLGELT